MERRIFLKNSCSICLAAAAGIVSMETFVSCSSTAVYKTITNGKSIAVPTSLFAQSSLQIIRAKGLENDIALRKQADGKYTALLLSCTHASYQLTSSGNGFYCNLHGSKFDESGGVVKGPAETPLRRFPTQIEADHVIIHLA